jgi:hypothetical protein
MTEFPEHYFLAIGTADAARLRLLHQVYGPGTEAMFHVGSDLGDEGGGDLDAVELLHDGLDVACGPALGVQREKLVVEPAEATLILADELRREGAVAVAGDVASDRVQFPLDGLLGVALAAVARQVRRPGFGRRIEQCRGLRAAEVDVHLGVEHALQSRLHQAAEQAMEFLDGAGLAGQLLSQLLRLGGQFRVPG